MEWYLKVVRDNYANFEGRARRKEYWMFVLFHLIFVIVLYMLTGILIVAGGEELGIIGLALLGIYALAVFIPSLGVIVRRLHDTGNSGWMYFVSLIPLIGSIWLLVLLCTDGDVGPNQYGPDPKAVYEDDLNEIGTVSNRD